MNYQKNYDALIQKRRENPLDKKVQYCECHHIIPKSLGGSNDDENLVNLTAKEHYFAHELLVKIYEWQYGTKSVQFQKMIAAIFYMSSLKQNLQTKRFTARLYAKLHVKGIDWRVGKTKEEIDEIKKKQVQWRKNWSKEKLKEYHKRCTETRLNWDEKKKQEWGQKRSRRMLSWSQSKKDAIAEKKRKTWFSKSKAERDRIQKQRTFHGKSNGMYGVHRFGESAPLYGWEKGYAQR